MKIKDYMSDPRYYKVLKDMEMLAIEDVSTLRQEKNGTIVWKLPIKNQWKDAKSIEVASFKTGYVRNNNSGYSNYQLNKRGFKDDYWPEVHSEWVDGEYVQTPTGKYNKYQTRTCKLIPIEIDRLEYLISYCLKNYYIKHANFVANGNYVAKWEHEWELKKQQRKNEETLIEEVKRYDNAVQPLEAQLDEAKQERDHLLGEANQYNNYPPREVIVTVNGHRYKVQ